MKSRVDFTTPQAQMIAQGTAPFVYMHHLHKSSRYVYPTVQVSCRLLVGELPEPERFLAVQIQTLKAAHADVKILESSDSAFLAGVSGFFIRSSFTITRADGARFSCLARGYTLITNGVAFNIGMSGPGKGPYVCEDDFQIIARSIRITAPGWQPPSPLE